MFIPNSKLFNSNINVIGENKKLDEFVSIEVLAQKFEICCHLCNNRETNKCWRRSLLEYLDAKSSFVLCLEEPHTTELEAIAEEDDENLSDNAGTGDGAHYQEKNYQKDLRG